MCVCVAHRIFEYSNPRYQNRNNLLQDLLQACRSCRVDKTRKDTMVDGFRVAEAESWLLGALPDSPPSCITAHVLVSELESIALSPNVDSPCKA